MIKEWIIKYKKISIILLSIIIMGIGAYYLFNFYFINENVKVVKEDSGIEKIVEEKKEEEPTYYYVDIKGAVINPNVYKVSEDARVIDVIKLAGGLTKDADTSIINLSKKIMDEMIIIIYTKTQIKQFINKAGSTSIKTVLAYAEKTQACPDPIINEACISDNSSTSETNSETSSEVTNTPITKVSINSATSTELQTLSGIGPSKATAIISYRNLNGPFVNIEDLKNVSGIGDSTFAKIKDYITV